MKSPAVFANLHGKIDPELENSLNHLFRGLRDHDEAIKSLKVQHDETATVATKAQTQATTATKQAAAANTQLAQPVKAGAVNSQTTDYTVQSSDHLGLVDLNGATAVTLNNLVPAPFMTYLQNSGSGAIALSSTAGTINGATSVPAGTTATAFYNGADWWVATAGGGSGGGTLAVYATNADAVTGGLSVGDFYRTGTDPSLVCVVF